MVVDELAGEVAVEPDEPQCGEHGAVRAGRLELQCVDQVEECTAVGAEVPSQQRHVVVAVVGGDLGVLGRHLCHPAGGGQGTKHQGARLLQDRRSHFCRGVVIAVGACAGGLAGARQHLPEHPP